MEEVEYKLCLRGHVKSPENVYPSGGCALCARMLAKNRKRSPEYKAWRKQSQSLKAYEKARKQTPEYMAYERARKQTPEYKAYYRSLQQAQGYKAYQKEYQSELRQTAEYKAYRKAYNETQKVNISDSYVCDVLKAKKSTAPPELIELKRLTIQLRRSQECQLKAKQ